MTPGRSSKNPDRLEIVWFSLATARLGEIRAYVALDKPRAAERLAMRVVTLVESLRFHPRLGHSSGQPGLRELTIGGTPYVIFCRLRRDRILISTIQSHRPTTAIPLTFPLISSPQIAIAPSPLFPARP